MSFETVKLTNEVFDAAVSSPGAFSRAQLAVLGVPWPPKQGWKKRLSGTYVPKAVVDEFIALKDKHRKKKMELTSELKLW